MWAGTPEKLKHLTKLKGVTIVQVGIHDEPSETWLAGLDVLVLVVPNDAQRVPATIKVARAACKARVPHVIVSSIATAEIDNVFGNHFFEIEKEVKELGAHNRTSFTIVRLPLYLDNYTDFEKSIKASATIRHMMDPNVQYTPISCGEMGEVIATIAADTTERWLGRTVTIAGEPHTLAEVVQWLSEDCGVQITYERISEEEQKERFLNLAMLEFQVRSARLSHPGLAHLLPSRPVPSPS